MAALASPGPIARARSAPVAPAGSRFSLPSGSVTRISRAVIDSVDRLVGRRGRGGGGGGGERRQRTTVAEVQRQRAAEQRADRDPAYDAAGRQDGGFVGHGGIFYLIIRNAAAQVRASAAVRPARRRGAGIPALARPRRVHRA